MTPRQKKLAVLGCTILCCTPLMGFYYLTRWWFFLLLAGIAVAACIEYLLFGS
jgi:hypothetical protein